MTEKPSLKPFWEKHAANMAQHQASGLPVIRGVFADCTGTIINDSGFIEEDLIEFLRAARAEKAMPPHVISMDIGGSRLIIDLNDVNIDDLPTQSKKDLKVEMDKTGAKLELLIDDEPAAKTLPAVTLIHPKKLLTALRM